MFHRGTPIIPFSSNWHKSGVTGTYRCIFCHQEYVYRRETKTCRGGFLSGCVHRFYHFHHTCRLCGGEWIEMTNYKEDLVLLKLIDYSVSHLGAEEVIDYINKKVVIQIIES